MKQVFDDVKVVDADSHYTPPHDMWVRRAPAVFKELVPRVVEVDGSPTWIVGKDSTMGFAGGGGVIDRNGAKLPFAESMPIWGLDEVHRAAWDPVARLEVLDQSGIHAQVLYPNAIGLGGDTLSKAIDDPVLRQVCIEIYNDAMAEIQDASANRLLPMPVMPAWDVDACVREADRVAGLGLRGINMTSDPQDLGAPDLANRAWDPFWSACSDLKMPVHFHIGASLTAMNFYGKYFWESQHEYTKPAIGGAMLFLGNARAVINSILCGTFDRHPDLKMVSVESGIGWIPFLLEAMDYEMVENAPAQFAELEKAPSEYFRSNWYATFWFERNHGNLQALFDVVGEDNVMFETDFPHPTCLYPDPVGAVADTLSTLTPQTRRKLLGENAAALYRLDH